ncbi:ATP-binding protein [Lachnoclostridium sp. Marseille-P6806]|uniref:ATP-binding protein n=1 Tax=Lachnoclostridium sp. Marseille-P6806 TaxID=2364793 RepID=UPI00103268FB
MNVISESDGIPPEKQAHLFDRFYRLDEGRNSEGIHYGPELSIEKAAVEQHGGNIGR